MQEPKAKKSEAPASEAPSRRPRGYQAEVCVFCFVGAALAKANFVENGGFYGGKGFPFFYWTFTDMFPPGPQNHRWAIPVNIGLCLAIAAGVTFWFRRSAISLGTALKYFAYYLGVMFLLMYWAYYVSWPRWLFSPGETFWNFNWAIVLYRGGELVFWPSLVFYGAYTAYRKRRQ